jgi:thiamine-phosphate pyrophosphorylase
MQKLDKKISSILDANFGRLSEGLRVLEDMSRFILRDYKITRKLKETRHSLLEESKQYDLEFLNSRGEDIGASLFAAGEGKRKNFVDLVVANAKRAEESLRVLEEYFKFLENKNWRKFQDSRFLLYNIEKEIVSKFSRGEKVKKLFPLYVILDAKYFKKKNPVELLKEVIKGGAKAVQLRDKKNNKRKILATALSLKKICRKASVLFLVNDYVDIALAVDADGVHLGDDDLPITAVRKILSFEKIIGRSVHSQKEAQEAEKEGADYISIGALYPTATKEDAILAKPPLIREIKNKISLPIVVIGGINENNLQEAMKFEVDGIAISKAILDKASPKTAVKKILSNLNK